MKSEDFSGLSFLEKKAMLDFAEAQRLAFEEQREIARANGDRSAKEQTDALNRWAGYVKALTTECELHLQTALGEGFTPQV